MPELNEAVIISAARTPVGKFLGSLKGFSATELGAIVVRESVKRAGIRPEDVDEVIMGCVIQAGLGQNPARQAALNAGIPPTVSAVTVNKVCGSGLKAVSESVNILSRLQYQFLVWDECQPPLNGHHHLKNKPFDGGMCVPIRDCVEFAVTRH